MNTASGGHSSQSSMRSSRIAWRWSGKARTSKSCTTSCLSGIPISAVAARTSRASVSGGKPSGSDFVAMEKAT